MLGWPQHLKEGMEQQLLSEFNHERDQQSTRQRQLLEAVAAERQKAVGMQTAAANAQLQAANERSTQERWNGAVAAASDGPRETAILLGQPDAHPGASPPQPQASADSMDEEDVEMLEVANAEEAGKASFCIIFLGKEWNNCETDLRRRLVDQQASLAKKARTSKAMGSC